MNKKLVHSVFEHVTVNYAHAIAVDEEQKSTTYLQVNNHANAIAWLLGKNTSQKESRIGLFFESSAEYVAAVIGSMKAGGVFVPFDLSIPKTRLEAMFTKCGPEIVLTSAALFDEVHAFLRSMKETGTVKNLVEITNEGTGRVENYQPEFPLTIPEEDYTINYPSTTSPDDAAYIYFTSGSTGIPKPILGCQKSISHFVHWESAEFGFNETVRVSQLTPTTFDANLRDIFLPLINGGKVCIPSKQTKEQPLKLLNWLDEKQVTVVHCVPSLFKVLTKEKEEHPQIKTPALQYIMMAGEPLYGLDVNKWRAIHGNGTQLVNFYGASETTMIKSFYRIPEEEQNPKQILPIGKPISNTAILIIQGGKLCVPGKIGEIYIKTPFATKGYFEEPELTAASFVQNPLSEEPDLIYKTGDLGKYRPDLSVDFVGRLDSQVKINGIRIELSEIEQAFLAHPAIEEVVVRAHAGQNNELSLISYFTATSTLDAGELRNWLKDSLPDYMLPGFYIQLPAFPLNINGKIDKKALPQPEELLFSGKEILEPVTETERKLAAIWCEILGLKRIGTNLGFFEIGGHSLKATRIISKILQELNVHVTIREFFDNPTVKELSELIGTKQTGSFQAIGLAPIQSDYDLSDAQKRMWMAVQTNPQSNAYSIFGAVEFSGGVLDVTALEKAFQYLIDRHEILRTQFKTIQGKPRQIIRETASFKLERADLNGNDPSAVLKTFLERESAHTFDLEHDLLLHTSLLQPEENRMILALNIHHIISDGWSMNLFQKELILCYEAYAKGGVPELPDLTIQYKDYSVWNNARLNSPEMKNAQHYWIQTLSQETPALNLPYDRDHSSAGSPKGAMYRKTFASAFPALLNERLKESGITLFTYLNALLKTQLYAYTGQSAISVGIPVAGRIHADLEYLQGCFVNTIVLRDAINGANSFAELLKSVQLNTEKAFEYQEYPFDQLIEELNPAVEQGRTPFFDVMLVLQNNEDTDLRLTGLKVAEIPSPHNGNKYDLTYFFKETAAGLQLDLEYNAALFDPETIQRFCDHFEEIGMAVLSDSSLKLNEIPLSGTENPEETAPVNTSGIPDFETVHTVFEKAVLRYAHAIAVDEEQKSTTYLQVNTHANAIAWLLGKNASQKESRIGLFFESSAEYVAAVIGSMKAGGVFVPFDLSIPKSRLEAMFTKCGPEIVLTSAALFDEVHAFLSSMKETGTVKNLVEITNDGIGHVENYQPEFPLTIPEEDYTINYPSTTSPDDAAYIYFTSGSTGIPKPILGCQKSISHFVHWESAEFGFNETVRVSQLTPTTFDANLRDIFLPLINGGRVCIPSKQTKEQPLKLLNWLDEKQVTVVHCVPSLFKVLTKEKEEHPQIKTPALQYIMMAGEPLYGLDVNKWRAIHGNGTQLVNFYGASETTMIKSFYRIPEEEQNPKQILPIGKPISNTAILIIQGGKLCVPGKIGEIYIKTPFATKGYFEEPELTAASFVQNPLSEEPDLIYKTGDLGKYRPDLSVDFVGRLDSQVKINGIRIELSEIEQAFLAHPAIEEVVVRAHAGQNNELSLISYFTATSTLDAGELRNWLKDSLPDYMLPGFYIQLPAFPLNINGKIDKKALPQPEELLFSGKEILEPVTETERKLAAIWCEILGLKRIGTNLGFFEIGGHSLKATRIISRIYQELNAEVSLKEFFESSTIAVLGKVVDSKVKTAYTPIPATAARSTYDLSDAQRRIWVLEQMNAGTTTYNMFASVVLNGKLNRNALSSAFESLVQRHEILRSAFINVDGKPQQRVIETEENPLIIRDLSLLNNSDEILNRALEEDAAYLFDLEKGGLIIARLYQLSEEVHVLSLNMHHIVSDGWSMNVLLDDIARSYNDFVNGKPDSEESLKVQYKDYAAWRNEQLANGVLDQQKAWWLEQFKTPPTPLDLSANGKRPKIKTYNGDEIRYTIPYQKTQQLRDIALSANTSLFTVLATLINTIVYRFTGEQDITIGTPVSGRNHPDIERNIGCFINTLPIRVQVDGKQSFAELLTVVREKLSQAFHHQAYPFDHLVEELDLPRDVSRAPVFDILMVLHNEDFNTANLEGITIQPHPFKDPMCKFDLSFNMFDHPDGIKIDFEYNVDIISNEHILQIRNAFEQLVDVLFTGMNQPVGMISVLPDPTVKQLSEFGIAAKDTSTLTSDTIIAAFNNCVLAHPDQTALVFEGKKYSYREVDELSNQIANTLLGHPAVSENSCVALIVERSAWSILGMLAILKAKCFYVPIEPETPQERIGFILSDSNCAAILTDDTSRFQSVSGYENRCITINNEKTVSTQLPELRYDSQDLAYIIYTSGSTGTPKGVMIEQKSVLNLISGLEQRIYRHYPKSMNVALLASCSFDASVQQIFASLLLGHTLHVIGQSLKTDPEALTAYLQMHSIKVMDGTPALFSMLLESSFLTNQKPELKHLLLGGEALSKHAVSRFYRETVNEHIAISNVYGPTETCVDVTEYGITASTDLTDDILSIGIPLPGVELLIVNEQLQLVPPGVIGELLISGPNVARGYVNQSELSAEVFISHPFDPSKICYKTGDFARWNYDGTIRYEGRRDHQVKLKGYRIELGEIENTLKQLDGVKDVALVVNAGDSTSVLVAYLVTDRNIELLEVRAFLGRFLPDYMFPQYVVCLDQFPLNTSGKLDRKALPDPLISAEKLTDFYKAPETEKERIIANVWSQILGKNRVGVNDNFFALGGDSIKAIQIVSALKQQQLQTSIQDIFRYPTIAELSWNSSAAESTMEEQEVHGLVQLAPIQKWFFEIVQQSKQHFNQSVLLKSERKLEADLLRQTFTQLCNHHDMLRASFRIENGNVIQEIAGEIADFTLEVVDLTGNPEYAPELERLATTVQKSFDLASPPLLKAALFLTDNGERLLITAHHLVIDGVSWRILAEDLTTIYAALQENRTIRLPLKTSSYQKWTTKLTEYAQSPALLAEIPYWKEIEAKLPVSDHPAPSNGTTNQRFALSKEKTQQLTQEANAAYNTDVNILLLTAFSAVYKTQNDLKNVPLMLEGHGREAVVQHVDITRTTGWFTSMYPVVLETTISDDPGTQIKQVKETIRLVPSKGIGYGILKYLTKSSEALFSNDRQPAILFNYLGEFTSATGGDFTLAGESAGQTSDPEAGNGFSMNINAQIQEGQLEIAVNADPAIWKPETIEQVFTSCIEHLEKLIDHCCNRENTEVTYSDITSAEISSSEFESLFD